MKFSLASVKWLLRASAVSGALGGLCLPASALQTDNFGMSAVPAPRTGVTIDGKLEEWDTSGQILMTYDIEVLSDVYSVRAAAMYDAEFLYLSLHWKDPIPMGNTHDPRYQANKGWAGDAVQLRFKTDRISHITAWYYAGKQEPALQIEYGKSLTEPFGGGSVQLFRTQGWKLEQGVEMAFLKDADGRGYVQEMKLPWRLITQNKPYRAGDNFNIGFELLWGESDWPVHRYADNLQPGASSREFFWTAHNNWGPITLEPRGQLKLPEPEYMAAYRRLSTAGVSQGPIEISYELPKDARVSLAIEDATGKRIRNLIAAQPRKQGRNVEKWDGLDDNGRPVAPGNYRYKGIYHNGIHSKYVLSFASPGNPSWETADGRGAYYGDHTPPQAAATAGAFTVLATPMGEAGKHLIGTDLNGQRLWGLPNRVAFDGGRISLATDGKVAWVATEGKKSIIYRVELATGRYAPWQQKAKDAAGNEYDVLDLVVSDEPGMIIDKENQRPANMRAIAHHAGALAVAFFRENAVRVLDGTTGAVRSRYSVPEPAALTVNAAGEFLVLSQGRILRLLPDGKTTPWSQALFPDGYGLASDASGQVFLSVRGAHHNVQVFSPQGQVVREIGKRGGRSLVGPYDANGMRYPAGIAVDTQGHLWVMEETMNPKRTSVWDVKTGQLWKDLAGTTTYSGAGALNPLDPSMGFSDQTVYRLNFQNGSSAPIYSLGGESAASHYAVKDEPNNLFPPVVHALTSKIVKRGPHTYIFSSGAARSAIEVHATLYDGKDFRSVAHFGVVAPRNDRKAENAKYDHPFFTGMEGRAYLWTDGNGDGLVQQPELVFGFPQLEGQPVQLKSSYWGQLPDDEGTVIYMAGNAGNEALKDVLLKFPITGTNASGAPLYNLTQPQVFKLEAPVVNPSSGMVFGGGQGRIYLNQDPLIALNHEGKVIGSYPNPHVSVHGSHTAKAARPGYLIGPSSFLGTADLGPEVGEIFYLNGNLGENYLFTQDGLYIQTLFKDTRGYFDTPAQAVAGMSMDATTAGGESFGGNFIKAADGKFYVTLGSTDARVQEVTGLESVRRLNGTFTYTPAQYGLVLAAAGQQSGRVQTPKTFTIGRAANPVNIDGVPDEWPELMREGGAVLEIQENAQQRYGRVGMRYDANALYLGYRVFAPRNQMKNAGQDDRLLFKTGDAVDLMLGPEKSANGAGNSRVLLTFSGGTPVAVLNQKVAPGAAPGEKFDFASPWRTISFDRVVVLNKVHHMQSPLPDGYFVEASIPWSSLGFTPQAGLKLKGDAGILFANAGGTATVARQYWSNKATGLVNDVPGEADLMPELWGSFVLEH